jgi:hypothetical protein
LEEKSLNLNIMELLILVLGILLVISIIRYVNQKKLTDRLWQEYVTALRGNDIGAALNAGRAYYTALRRGRPTLHDEQTISNDLKTMRKEA